MHATLAMKFNLLTCALILYASAAIGGFLVQQQITATSEDLARRGEILTALIAQNSGSSPSRVGDFGLSSDRVEHAGEDFQAQVLLVA